MKQREIKFRVWDGEAMYDATLYPDWTMDNFVNMHRVSVEYGPDPERFKLMQWTGLKDKNGKDIFEGDIITNGTARRGRVEWHQASASWDATPINKLGDSLWFMAMNWMLRVEVVGNIFENPELCDPTTI